MEFVSVASVVIGLVPRSMMWVAGLHTIFIILCWKVRSCTYGARRLTVVLIKQCDRNE
ncbi:hypothetical protein ASPFODRAFT_482077 [Aspergillus luchuensis CBS 106.47]|uniref:Uncharacterized protein n=1 Tax=Aspergillus luchuensis (strain CBS 106.47) TaxID=1137211 RepID=A0A1M3TRE9_ASPLC|nr:hypothetical protein ASPFODRAFT_482077 [Aspergillus luchuensis CBS 106.47]